MKDRLIRVHSSANRTKPIRYRAACNYCNAGKVSIETLFQAVLVII
jgi:hypothetical protein